MISLFLFIWHNFVNLRSNHQCFQLQYASIMLSWSLNEANSQEAPAGPGYEEQMVELEPVLCSCGRLNFFLWDMMYGTSM